MPETRSSYSEVLKSTPRETIQVSPTPKYTSLGSPPLPRRLPAKAALPTDLDGQDMEEGELRDSSPARPDVSGVPSGGKNVMDEGEDSFSSSLDSYSSDSDSDLALSRKKEPQKRQSVVAKFTRAPRNRKKDHHFSPRCSTPKRGDCKANTAFAGGRNGTKPRTAFRARADSGSGSRSRSCTGAIPPGGNSRAANDHRLCRVKLGKDTVDSRSKTRPKPTKKKGTRACQKKGTGGKRLPISYVSQWIPVDPPKGKRGCKKGRKALNAAGLLHFNISGIDFYAKPTNPRPTPHGRRSCQSANIRPN